MADDREDHFNTMPFLDERWTSRLRAKLEAGEAVDFAAELASLAPDERALRVQQMLALQLHYLKQQGEEPQLDEFLERHPDWGQEVRSAFEAFTSPTASNESTAASDLNAADTQPHAGDAMHTETWKAASSSSPTVAGQVPSIHGYELLETIGRGGMGLVFKARHLGLRRFVALKLPLSATADDPHERERFLREARASAQLRHAHICPIYDVGEAEGRPYMAMAFIRGRTLKQWAAEERPSEKQAAEIVSVLARAVGYAHDHNVIHRDIKPSNVMVDDETSTPVLMDFGLAKNVAEQDNQLTQSGQIMGTPAYMAPEQASGKIELVGKLSDVYSLGAVLYELLTGRPPFLGNSGEVIHQLLSSMPERVRKVVPSIHQDLETICLKAMARNSSARYSSATALAEDLDRFAAGKAIHARRESWIAKGIRAVKNNRRTAGVIVGVVAIAAATVIHFASGTRDAQQLAAQGQQFETWIEEADWQDHRLEQLEQLVADTRQLDEQTADRLQSRLYEQYAESLRKNEIFRPRLSADEIPDVEARIAWLEDRDATQAAELRVDLQNRLRQWQDVFELRSPFDDAESIFESTAAMAAKDTLLGRAAASEYVDPSALTIVAGASRTQLAATFAPSWRDVHEVGLVLNGQRREDRTLSDGGYTFRIRAVEGKKKLPFSKCRQCDVEIVRDGAVIQRVGHAMTALGPPGQTLTVTATRQDDRLRLVVGDLPPLEFEDIFPLASTTQGCFGVVLPKGAELVSLVAREQALPPTPSPLERADELFAQGEWDAALTLYQTQAASADSLAIRELSQYKEAICLRRVNREDEAIEILESLLESSAQRTRILAACQLWLIRLRRRDFEGAEPIFSYVQSQYTFQDLALLVPSTDRERIIEETYGLAGGINLFRFGDDQLRYLERTVEVERLLERGMVMATMREFQLMRGYHMVGQLNRALSVGERMLEEYQDTSAMNDGIIEEHTWLMRQLGQSRQARQLIDSRVHADPEYYTSLLLEKARIAASAEQYPSAMAALDQLESSDAYLRSYRIFGGAQLLRGAIWFRQMQSEKARAAWKAGVFPRWLEASPQRNTHLTGIELEYGGMLGALGQEMTPDTFALLLERSNIGSNGSFLSSLVKHQAQRFAPHIVNMGRREEVIEDFCRIAMRDCSLRFHVDQPILAMAVEFTRSAPTSGDWSKEESDAIRSGLEQAMEAFRRGDIVESQGAQLLAAFGGVTGIFGWSGVADKLPIQVRATAAYVFGHRMVKESQNEKAKLYFDVVVRDVDPASPLKRLAEQQLRKLQE